MDACSSKQQYTKIAAATLVGCVLSLLAAPARAQDNECTEVFVFTGDEQEFMVPSGVTEITVNAFGAQGGSLPAAQNPGTGGLGAGATGAVLVVASGETLQVVVGSKADDVGAPPNNPETPGGFNGGGDGGPLTNGTVHGGAGGGGASDVRRGSERLVIAGGGGGGSHGGSGGHGGEVGEPGQDNQGTTDAQGGGGATQGAGGAGGAGDGAEDGEVGTQFQGGAGGGNVNNIDAGGGGGGGFFSGGGGGGGTASAPGGGAGGGGGSSMGPPGTTFETGAQEGDGRVEILYEQPGCGALEADLTVSKQATVNADNTVIFTLVVENLGPDDATGPVTLDALPLCTQYLSDDCGGEIVSEGFRWEVGALPSGGSATCNVTVDAAECAGEGPQTNAVTVEGELPDPNPENNQDEVEFEIEQEPSADLAITKTVAVTQSTVVFGLEVTNDGPTGATGVMVNDELPECVVYQSDTCEGDPGPPFTWEIGSLAVGESAMCEITVDAAGCEGQQTNTASVEGDDEDPTPDNNTDDAVFDIGEEEGADVSVTQDPTVDEDGTVDFEIEVSNDGPEDATGVEVTDELPECAAYASDDCGGQEGPPFTWTIGALANGASASCTMTAEASSCEGEQTAVVEVTADQDDPDPDDNTVETVFDIEVVPALPWLATVLLILLLLIIATWTLRRSRA